MTLIDALIPSYRRPAGVTLYKPCSQTFRFPCYRLRLERKISSLAPEGHGKRSQAMRDHWYFFDG